MEQLLVCERYERGVAVLTVSGELDIATGDQLDEHLSILAAVGDGRVVLDAAGLTFCDASGVTILLRGQVRASAQGGWLRLWGGGAQVRRVLALVALTEVLPVFESLADAVDGALPRAGRPGVTALPLQGLNAWRQDISIRRRCE